MAGAWFNGLVIAMKDPKNILYEDVKIVIIKDLYAKARFHFLVLPKEEISSIRSVNHSHISLLKHMEEKAREYCSRNAPNTEFSFGYHAQPSMHRLHLHAISKDMISDCLKNKKHWNSFTTEFFISSHDIIRQLTEFGKIHFPSSSECEEYLKRNLKCNTCKNTFPTMPKLKVHLLTHV